MAEPVEVRRVVIEMDFRVPDTHVTEPGVTEPEPSPALVEAVRRELIRQGSRNPNIFGGRA